MIEDSLRIIRDVIESFRPTHIVSMVSGGKDSACSNAVAEELGIPVDLILHGNTRCGIPETSQFVEDYYGNLKPDFAIADAGTAYEDYVLRKGFFGMGPSAHGFSYRILKAQPFRAAITKHIRKHKHNIRVMLLNGARKDESENRRKNLQVTRADPARPNNLWVNVIHNWTLEDRDAYITDRGIPINPVAKALCRSGECMCGTMQSKAERAEAAVLYPEWGRWLADLEAIARTKFGYGWAEPFSKQPQVVDDFQPMCKDCLAR